jgi:hypothetical protein
MTDRRPPRAAEWLVERSLPIDTAEREAVLGDLAEEHFEIAQRRGTVAADLWYRSNRRMGEREFSFLKKFLPFPLPPVCS